LNNGKIDVTGMLLYRAGAFLQALEGDERSVRGVFGRIEKDPRHAKVTVLRNHNSFGEGRIFGSWSMGFVNASSNAHVLKGFLDLAPVEDLLTLSETQAMNLLASSNRTAQKEQAPA
jgi:Sensors of blue-light using FAD